LEAFINGINKRLLVKHVAALSDYEVVSKTAMSESIKSLGIIGCDICKSANASYDVFVKGIVGVSFLRRCCERCVNDFGG
jgi:hypothetical protein